MARQTQIDIKVNETSAVTSIGKLKKAFEELNASKEKLGKNGKIELGLDAGVLKTFSESIKELNSVMSSHSAFATKLDKSGKEIANYAKSIGSASSSISDFGKEAQKTRGQIASMTGEVLALVSAFAVVARVHKVAFSDYFKLTDASYGVGIASQMSVSSINELNDSFLNLSRTLPVSAVEMAKATDALVRTGRSYKEARDIMEQTAILSVASGGSLKDTAEVVTKVMVSLNIGADKVTDTLNTMHSTAIQTASDMKYLADAFKNVAGTTSVLVKSSGLAGKELEGYKQKVLDLSMASIGSMANLGLGASSAGTKIKTLFGKMVAGEKSSRLLFDNMTRLNNIKFDKETGMLGGKGELFDFKALSNLTQEDLPKALELLSQMYVKGQLTSVELQKMFTARHFMEISNLLIDINGNTDSFVESLAKGVDYSVDFEKSLFSVTKQFEIFKKSLFASFGETLGKELTESLTGILMVANPLSNALASMTKGLSSFFGKLIVIVPTVALATVGFVKICVAVASLSIPIATAIGAVSALIMGISYLGRQHYNAKKEVFDLSLAFTELTQGLKKADTGLLSLENRYSTLNRELARVKATLSSGDIGSQFLFYNIEEESTIFGQLLGQSKEYISVLEALKEYRSLESIASPLVSIEDTSRERIKTRTEEIKKLKKEINDIDTAMIEKILGGETLSTVNDGIVRGGLNISEAYTGAMKDLIAIHRDYVVVNAQTVASTKDGMSDMSESSSKATRVLGDVVQELADKYKITKGEVLELNKSMSKLRDSDVDPMIKMLNETLASMNVELESATSLWKEFNDQVQKNATYVNRSMSYLASLDLELFRNTGQLNFDGKILTGIDAIGESFARMNSNSVLVAKKSTADRIAWLEKEVDMTKAIAETGDEETKAKARENLALFEKELLNKKRQQEEMEGANVSALNDTASAKAIANAKKLLGSITDIHKYSSKVSTILQAMYTIETTDDALVKKTQQDIIDRLHQQIVNENKIVKVKDNKTSYEIKYNNYLKDNLDLELEKLKINKAIAEQGHLAYVYKLKQIDADKKLLEGEYGELGASKTKLKSAIAMGIAPKEWASVTTAKGGQDALKKFYESNEGELSGKQGGDIKGAYTALEAYVKALVKAEELTNRGLVEGLQRYSSILQDIPSTWAEVYTQLNEAKELGFVGVGIDIQGMSRVKAEENIKNSITEYNDWMRRIAEDQASIGGGEVSILDLLLGSLSYENIETTLLQAMTELDSLKEITNELDSEQVKLLDLQMAKVEHLKKLAKEKTDEAKRELDIRLKIVDSYNRLGSVMSKLGSLTNTQGLEDLGGLLTSFGELTKYQADPKNSFDINKLLDFKAEDFAKNFSNAMESALKGMDMGASIGGLIGGQSSQAGGAMGGLVAGLGGDKLSGALGMSTGATGMAISAGMAIIGGLFEDDGKATEEAEKRTKEANKQYSKNTDALQKLAQNMANLSGGVDSLNSSLISSFSKIPTFGKLTTVTDTLRQMYVTMEQTRNFTEVAYQYTKKTSGSSGFLGIGAKPGTTETVTVKMETEKLLKQWGFEGTLEEMSSQQMRDFANWLDDYDLGDTDNFSILADALKDYAEALDKMNVNIDKLFYDATMEGFAGISSLQQEELRQQIEDFYKNLGMDIDEELSAEIDKLAEQMSVMVTVMQDVRSGFVDSWRETGESAGDAFLSSMTPYVDAMLENISQVFYDVYFSDITESLENEFKDMAEQLVELKKQGADMKFDDLAGALSGSFGNVIASIKLAQSETANFNDILLVLQQQAFESGLTLSEMLELGLVTGTQGSVIESFKEALLSSDSESAFTSIGKLVGDKVGDALADKMLDNLLSSRILEFSANLDKIVGGSTDMTFDSLALLAQESMSVGLMLESEQKRLSAIRDMFDFNKDITYQKDDSNISYQTGTTQSITQYITLTSSVEVANLVESDSVHSFVRECAEDLLDVLKDKGIDISKISTN